MCRLSRDFGLVHRCRVCRFLSWPIFSSRVIFFSRASTFCSIFFVLWNSWGQLLAAPLLAGETCLPTRKILFYYMVVCIWVQQFIWMFWVFFFINQCCFSTRVPVRHDSLRQAYAMAMESTKTDTAMNKCIPAGASGLFRAQAICMYISGKCVMYSG